MSSAEVSIEDARRKLGELGNAAELTGVSTIITRNGRPFARIAPLEDTVTSAEHDQGAEIDRSIQQHLLAVPAIDVVELRRRGVDPTDKALLRLDGDHGVVWPDFQFDAAGVPLELVREINRILGVEEDPWGVADWWLGENGWLDGVPAHLIGNLDNDVLIRAARADREIV